MSPAKPNAIKMWGNRHGSIPCYLFNRCRTHSSMRQQKRSSSRGRKLLATMENCPWRPMCMFPGSSISGCKLMHRLAHRTPSGWEKFSQYRPVPRTLAKGISTRSKDATDSWQLSWALDLDTCSISRTCPHPKASDGLHPWGSKSQRTESEYWKQNKHGNTLQQVKGNM